MKSIVVPESAKYQLGKCLGEGLSSRVFAAIREDSRGFSKQEVVLKILKNETDVSWFKREFATLSQLRSPHCVQIFGWENLIDGPALVLEKIDGLTLRDLCRYKPFDDEEISEIKAQLREGLHAIHGAGVCHGDISPTNIMIDRSGTIRLIDFAFDVNSRSVTGTPAFIAPEIWEKKRYTAQSDLFSAGVLVADLKNALRNIPTDPTRARLRALAMADSCSLTARNPEERKFDEVRSRQDVKEKLAEHVREALLEQENVRVQTQLLKVKTQNWRSQLTFGLRIVAIAFSIFTIVMTPAFSRDNSHRPAKLEIRSNKWLEISVDEMFRGYAPLDIPELAPGAHVIKWRSAKGSGELRILLMAGETKRIVADRLNSRSR